MTGDMDHVVCEAKNGRTTPGTIGLEKASELQVDRRFCA